MIDVILASIAFALGALLMTASAGFTNQPLPSASSAASSPAPTFSHAPSNTKDSPRLIGLGIEAIATTVFGLFLLQERLNPTQATGLAIIVVGVAIVRLGQHDIQQQELHRRLNDHDETARTMRGGGAPVTSPKA